MIKIVDKEACCGCSACVQKCPQQCISLKEDEEGFLYPAITEDACIDCGVCEKVCPVINQGKNRFPLNVYAAIASDERIRLQSSSGGIFTLLAIKVLEEGGVVFGARFDENWEVKHDYTEIITELSVFRGSKYLQSRMEDNYRKAEVFLKQGRKVLFAGTSCQIAGLKCFLRKEYDNLLGVDFICHGVPSPKVWRMYLDETIARQCEKKSVLPYPVPERNTLVESISFRDKRVGWKKYSFSLTLSTPSGSGAKNTVFLSEVFTNNAFMKGFLANLYLRPSCHQCAAKFGKSGSDITIADFWGIQQVMPDFDDDKGTGLVLVNTLKGEQYFTSLDINARVSSWENVRQYNVSFEKSAIPHRKRKAFFETFYSGFPVSEVIARCLHIPLYITIFYKVKNLARRIVKNYSS